MIDSTSHVKKLLPQTHRQFVYDMLVAAGSAKSDAEKVTEILLWSDLQGRHTNGIVRLSILAERLSRGLINSPATMTWTPLAPAVYSLDAGHGFGQVSGSIAMVKAIELAKSQGIGLVVVRHSNHYGAASYYCNQAAEAGCFGMTCTNAFPKVAAFGGKVPVLGTNPIAFGCPTLHGVPILVDLSTSAISGAEVRSKVDKSSNKLPLGVALDKSGQPTDDPKVANTGCLLPAAGPKGFGLGLIVEILSGILSGAAMGREVGSLFHTWDRPVNVGHMFMSIEIERFMPRDTFLNRLDTLLDWIKSSPRQVESEPIRFPGEIHTQYIDRYTREGIPLAEETVVALEKLSEKFKVKLPW
jgi:ureidoglycolate dehydrogenase (NAD+)